MTDDGGTAQDPRLRDYVAWHTAYDDPSSALSARLREVQAQLTTYLEGTAPAAVQVISVCAGEGRDILGVLAQRDDRERVTGALVEIDEAICAVADAEIVALGCAGRIIVRRADAGLLSAYEGLRPADLLLLSGIMGNITAADIRRLIHVARTLCAPGATVLWTRGAQEPDLGPAIRAWFDEAGFERVSVTEQVEGTAMRVGVERLVADPASPLPEEAALQPSGPEGRIFTFYR
ncbi:MAG: SAM-dependent methyltransferase [Actinobacteria bacterium]|nr:SAM-dependent methyltransferase [Actinomycetota bacterium]